MMTTKRLLLAVGLIFITAGVVFAQAGQPAPQPGQPGAPPLLIKPSQPGQPQVVQVPAPGQPGAPRVVVQQAPTAGSGTGTDAPEQPKPYGTGAALAFWLFAFMVVVGSIVTITRRNAVTAVMSLVATFVALAAVYVMLFAHFLAAIQVLVYAGAIMVLFVFVIMILNKEEEEPWAWRGLITKALAVGGLVYVGVRFLGVLWEVRDDAMLTDATWKAGEFAAFGSTKGIGKVLFTSYLFPFEAVSLVLLIAVVGALVLAHPDHPTATEATAAAKGEGAGHA